MVWYRINQCGKWGSGSRVLQDGRAKPCVCWFHEVFLPFICIKYVAYPCEFVCANLYIKYVGSSSLISVIWEFLGLMLMNFKTVVLWDVKITWHHISEDQSTFCILFACLEFFIDIILLALGSTQPLTEMSTRNICWG
jgi:hypothetical protein